MSAIRMTPTVLPALLEFRGPDAVRFLNGQVTQDISRVTQKAISLPSCVTDAKGRLQFRVTLTATDDGALWVAGPTGVQEALEARLTRYLIADDVEVSDLSGNYFLTHFLGPAPQPPASVMARESNRFGIPGTDWWTTDELNFKAQHHHLISADELEALRIEHGIPAWGHELQTGMLPPEALLERTDISYHKGCYVGQEVISRIKSAGKINRRLTRFAFAPDVPVTTGPLVDSDGAIVGELTSVSPILIHSARYALGFLKRGVSDGFFKTEDGCFYPALER